MNAKVWEMLTAAEFFGELDAAAGYALVAAAFALHAATR